jgi:outer membrane protein assembly factor BamB
MLWHVAGRNQVVGSASFKDISGDKVPDVFIGGRTGELLAINRATDSLIWRVLMPGTEIYSSPAADFNNDGFDDGLISLNSRQVQINHRSQPGSQLWVYDFHHKKEYSVSPALEGNNIGSPLAGRRRSGWLVGHRQQYHQYSGCPERY